MQHIHTTAPCSISYHMSPAPLNQASNSATDTGVVSVNDSIVLVNSASLYRTRHSIALQNLTATVALGVKLNRAYGFFQPHVGAFNAPQNGRIILQFFRCLVPHDANRCAVH